jgi:hypothetical protein
MKRALHNRVAYGNAILSRFAALTVPAALKSDLAAFKAQHAAFLKQSAAVDKANRAYDAASKDVARLDRVRDKTVLAIADELPAAGLGKRGSPFASFSRYAPTKLTTLPYAAQTIEMRSLVAGIAGAKPPAGIKKLCDTAAAQNEEVAAALEALDVPRAALQEAREVRDATIPDWDKCLGHLEDASKVAFRNQPGRAKALFAEPDAVETRVRPTKRARPAPPAPNPGDPPMAATAAKPKRKRRRR